MDNKYIRQLLKPLFTIMAIIIVCSFLVRILMDSETLSDYAAKNPELAYGDSASHIDEETEKKENEMEFPIAMQNYNLFSFLPNFSYIFF